MRTSSARIAIRCERFDTTYFIVHIGGQPNAFVNSLTAALQGARSGLTSRRLVLLLASAYSQRRLRSAALYFTPEIDAAYRESVDFTYDITFAPLKPIWIEIHEISDANVEDVYYRGTLENFINFQLKQVKQPRGRTPTGYSRSEWVEQYNSARKPDTAPVFGSTSLKEQIARERAKAPPPKLNLEGVREWTLEEREARKKSDARIVRERRKKHMKKSLDTDD